MKKSELIKLLEDIEGDFEVVVSEIYGDGEDYYYESVSGVTLTEDFRKHGLIQFIVINV